jgi:hypothetical protein
MLCASRCLQRWCSHNLSPRISQPSNKCYGERPVLNGLQYGCGMARPDCSVALHVLPANRNKTKSRRADSNRGPNLITSVRSVVAERCTGLHFPHNYAVLCSLDCPLLQGIASGLGSN